MRLIRWLVGSRALLLHLPPRLALAGTAPINLLTDDVLLTPEEVDGLLVGILGSESPPIGRTGLARWLFDHRGTVGRRYASEVARHFR